MRKTSALMAVLAALAWAQPGWAGSAGADPFNFLFLDANARVVGMGGAYTALAADANALLYNPAGLGNVTRHEATFMHNEYFQGIQQEYAGYASPRGWGVDVIALKSGDVPRTTLSNPSGTGLESAALNDLALGAGYGARIGRGLSLGAGFKYVRESIDGISAQGYGVDLGALYLAPALKGLSLGLAVQNMGPDVKFKSAPERMPLNLRAGAAYGFKAFDHESVLSLDVAKERQDKAVVGFGAEVVVAKVMPVRLGFNSRNDAGPGITAGLGWSQPNFAIDYAFVPFGDLGAAHRLSATVRWGGAK